MVAGRALRVCTEVTVGATQVVAVTTIHLSRWPGEEGLGARFVADQEAVRQDARKHGHDADDFVPSALPVRAVFPPREELLGASRFYFELRNGL